jgi:hypothetical protein
MLPLDDPRWAEMTAGYRVPLDARPLLLKLERGLDPKATWDALWTELHHQGDVGEASYAAVPHLVRIYRQRGVPDWQTYAIVATIELARNQGSNPDIPEWLELGYFEAVGELAEIAASEILKADTPEAVRAILAILAIAKGQRIYGRFLDYYSEEELIEMEDCYLQK